MSEARPLRDEGPQAGPCDAPESLPGPYESLPVVGRILALLAAGPGSGRAIARGLGIRWSTAFAALRQLQAAGAVVREGRGRAARYRVAAEGGHGARA